GHDDYSRVEERVGIQASGRRRMATCGSCPYKCASGPHGQQEDRRPISRIQRTEVRMGG
ncbi:hypothetical protein LTR29_018149, partial [Friedmanniomyces endolithicus]